MGYEKCRLAFLAYDLADIVADCQAGLIIQCGKWFIQEQKIRL